MTTPDLTLVTRVAARLALALACVAAVGGCSKDEPAPPSQRESMAPVNWLDQEPSGDYSSAECPPPGRADRPFKALFVMHSNSHRTRDLLCTLARAVEGDVVWVNDPPSGAPGRPEWGATRAATVDHDASPYDLVVLGSPIWFLGPTEAIHDAVSRLDLKGKSVVTMYTYLHGYTDQKVAKFHSAVAARGGKVIDTLAEQVPMQADESVIVRRGREIVRDRLTQWIATVRPELMDRDTGPSCTEVATRGLPVVMCRIPAGVVWSGCLHPEICPAGVGEALLNALPAFWVDRGEVTFEQYQACVAGGGCPPVVRDGASEGLSGPGLPVIAVPALAAEKFCAWTGRRLATQPEWERAARGSTIRPFPWGNEPLPATGRHRRGNFAEGPETGRAGYATGPAGLTDGYPELSPPCTFPDGNSPFGVCDLAGNLLEWVSEPSGDHTLVGGSWLDAATYTYTISVGSPRGIPIRVPYLSGVRCAADDRHGKARVGASP